MNPFVSRFVVPCAFVLAFAGRAVAQTSPFTLTLPDHVAGDGAVRTARAAGSAAQPVTGSSGEWTFTVYPILAWVPTNISIDVDLPFDPGSGSGGGSGSGSGGGRVGGSIVDPRFDGAFLAGMSATNGTWRVDFDGVYAAVGGDRTTPTLTVDVDLIYAHASVAREIAGGFFVTGGVRRFALEYDIDLLDYEHFTRKPGIWDPLVGVAYHKTGGALELHAHAEYGGFGVGADQDLGLGARVDWKPWSHFGFTAGYSLVRFKFKEEIGRFEFKATQTIGGPVVGVGLYF